MCSRQESGLEPDPGGDLFDASLAQYHGNVLVHFSDADAVRPYIIFGLGATNFNPDAGDIESAAKFSFTVGGGMKVPINESVGARLQLRPTPTYVSAEPARFSDIFGFCYVVGVADYAYRGELTGGVISRF